MKTPSMIATSPVPSRRLLGTLLMSALASLLGACTVSVEADVPDVEVVQHDVEFAGVPFAATLGEVSTEMSFTRARPDLHLPAGFDPSVKAMKIDLVAKTGVSDFSFIRSLRITMAPMDGSTAVELINYEKADGAVVGSTLTIPSVNPVNILDQWKADSAVFTVQIAGSLPEVGWTIDLHAHFNGQVSYKY
jgi:hypothetical protein